MVSGLHLGDPVTAGDGARWRRSSGWWQLRAPCGGAGRRFRGIHGLGEGVGREAPVAAMAARARGRSCRREQPKEGVGAGGETGRGSLRNDATGQRRSAARLTGSRGRRGAWREGPAPLHVAA